MQGRCTAAATNPNPGPVCRDAALLPQLNLTLDPYAGTLHCCCNYGAAVGVVNSCDIRRHVPEEETKAALTLTLTLTLIRSPPDPNNDSEFP